VVVFMFVFLEMPGRADKSVKWFDSLADARP